MDGVVEMVKDWVVAGRFDVLYAARLPAACSMPSGSNVAVHPARDLYFAKVPIHL